jgi:hypothetical protein
MNIGNSQKLIAITLLILSSTLLTLNLFLFFQRQGISFLSGNISESSFSLKNTQIPLFQNSLSLPPTEEIVELSITAQKGTFQLDSSEQIPQTTLQTFSNQESETLITGDETQTLLLSRSNPHSIPQNLEKSAMATSHPDQKLVVNAMTTESESIFNLQNHTSSVDVFVNQSNSRMTLRAPSELSEPFILEIDSINSFTNIYVPKGARLSIEGDAKNIYSQIPLVQVGPQKITNSGTSTHLYTLRLNQDQNSTAKIFTY